MSTIPTLGLTQGGTANYSDINTVLTAWNNAKIGGENIREEGLDARVLNADAVHPDDTNAWQRYRNNSAATFNHTARTILNYGGTDFHITGLQLNQANGEELAIHAGGQFWVEVVGIAPFPTLNIQLGYCTDYAGAGTGTWTYLGLAWRKFRLNLINVRKRGSFTISHRFTESVSSSATLTFGIFGWITGLGAPHNFEVGYPYLFSRRRDC